MLRLSLFQRKACRILRLKKTGEPNYLPFYNIIYLRTAGNSFLSNFLAKPADTGSGIPADSTGTHGGGIDQPRGWREQAGIKTGRPWAACSERYPGFSRRESGPAPSGTWRCARPRVSLLFPESGREERPTVPASEDGRIRACTCPLRRKICSS